jgi:hypothetical protein
MPLDREERQDWRVRLMTDADFRHKVVRVLSRAMSYTCAVGLAVICYLAFAVVHP